MRMIAALVLIAAVAGGEAQASSFVTPEALPEPIGPSFVVLGETTAAGTLQVQENDAASGAALSVEMLPMPSFSIMGEAASSSTPSIVALGEPAAGIAYDEVAAIPQPAQKSGRVMMPMIIRGGIVGDAFAQPIYSSGAPDEAPTVALDPNDRGTASKRKALKRQAEQQRAMESAPQAAPAPKPLTE